MKTIKRWVLDFSPSVTIVIGRPNLLLKCFVKLLGWKVREIEIDEDYAMVSLWINEYPKIAVDKAYPELNGAFIKGYQGEDK